MRIAVITSVIDPGSAAVTGFHRVLPRDAPDSEPVEDLAARAPEVPARPVVGVILTHGQEEYGYGRPRRQGQVAEEVTRWLAAKDCAWLELETRLDTHDRHLSATPAQLQSVLARLDLVVTDRLHGLVIALRAGTPVPAVDPVSGGARLTAQARACGWPALLPAERLEVRRLDRWWDWCLTGGRVTARQIRDGFREGACRTTRTGSSRRWRGRSAVNSRTSRGTRLSSPAARPRRTSPRTSPGGLTVRPPGRRTACPSADSPTTSSASSTRWNAPCAATAVSTAGCAPCGRAAAPAPPGCCPGWPPTVPAS